MLLRGRQAGKKAVVVSSYPNGTDSAPFAHSYVIGLEKVMVPRLVLPGLTVRQIERRMRMSVFLRKLNWRHLMVTRHTLPLQADDVNIALLEDPRTRLQAKQMAQALMRQRFNAGKDQWFFTKLQVPVHRVPTPRDPFVENRKKFVA